MGSLNLRGTTVIIVASYMALSAQAWLERQQKLNWQIGVTSGARRF